MRNNLVETIMGAVVLLITGGFLFFAFSHSKGSSGDTYQLSAIFSKSVDGLSVGGDVKIAGIVVGSITKLALDEAAEFAIVEMKINKAIRLPDDTGAKITSSGLLGGNYLSLETGGSDELFEDGDEITETQGSVDIFDLIQTFAGGDDSSSKSDAKDCDCSK